MRRQEGVGGTADRRDREAHAEAREHVRGEEHRPVVRLLRDEEHEGEDALIQEARVWQGQGWTARVIKNEDDEGWAVAMIKDGEPEPGVGRSHAWLMPILRWSRRTSTTHTGVLSALMLRGKTGVGSRVDVSMLESLVEWMGYPLYYAYKGATPSYVIWNVIHRYTKAGDTVRIMYIHVPAAWMSLFVYTNMAIAAAVGALRQDQRMGAREVGAEQVAEGLLRDALRNAHAALHMPVVQELLLVVDQVCHEQRHEHRMHRRHPERELCAEGGRAPGQHALHHGPSTLRTSRSKSRRNARCANVRRLPAKWFA